MSILATPTSAPILPPRVRAFIATFDALRRRRAFWRALGQALLFSCVWMLGCCLFDRWLKLNADARITLLVIHGLVIAYLIVPALWRLLSRRVDWMKTAGEIESRNAPLAGRLQTLTSQSLEPVAAYRGSPEFIEVLATDVSKHLQNLRATRLLSRKPILLPWLLSAGVLLIASALVRQPTLDLPTLARRYLMPTAKIAPVTTTRLNVSPGDTQVVEGNALVVRVTASRLDRESHVELHTRRKGVWTTSRMAQSAGATYQATIDNVDEELRYFVTGGDAVSPTYNVHLLRRPVVQGIRVRCDYPAATGKASETFESVGGTLDVPSGTDLTIDVRSSEPLSAATMSVVDGTEYNMAETDRPNVRRASTVAASDLVIRFSVTSVLNLRSSTPARLTVRAIPDQKPQARLSGVASELRLQPRDIQDLPFEAADDWGIRSLKLHIEVSPSQAVERGTLTNVARGKPTTQSSVAFDADGSRAVDGNSDGDFKAGSVTHTAYASNNFWQVDLGRSIPISVVEVWNRTDVASERLREFDVIVSDEPLPTNPPPATAPAGADVIHVSEVCGSPSVVDVYRSGRYVRVSLPRQDFLSLAEVRVYEALPTAVDAGMYDEEPFDDMFSPQQSATRTRDRTIPLVGTPKQRDGHVELDLAELDVNLGDVVTLSLVATDTAGQTSASDRSRVLISPRSVDIDTYRRIRELESANAAMKAAIDELAAAEAALGAINTLAGANGVGVVHQHLTTAADLLRAGGTGLIRGIAQRMPPIESTATAGFVDAALTIAGEAVDITDALSSVGPTGAPAAGARVKLISTQASELRQKLAVMIDGDKASALLAEIENLTASQRVPPQATKEAAERTRQRLAQMEQDIAAGARELSLDPKLTPNLQGQLKQKVDAAAAWIASQKMIDFSGVLSAWSQQPTSAAVPRAGATATALAARLTAASRAEALRFDADPVRAQDLGLLQQGVVKLASPVEQGAAATAPSTQPSFTRESLATAAAGLHQEHALNRSAESRSQAPPAVAVREAAELTRSALRHWLQSQGQSPSSVAAMNRNSPAGDANRQSEAMAFRAGALAAQGKFDEATSIDRELRARENSPSTAGNAALRMDAVARRFDQLADAQNLLAEHSASAATSPATQTAARADLAERQRLLAQAIRAAGPLESQGDTADSRTRADRAMRSARRTLAGLPDAIARAQEAANERRVARQRAEAAQKAAAEAGLEDWARANRASSAAANQQNEADERYKQASAAVDADVSDAMADALRPFAPETEAATRSLDERLTPGLAGLRQAAASADAAAMQQAAAEASAAAMQINAALGEAHQQLLADDPLLQARSAATAAAELLTRNASRVPSSQVMNEAAALQQESAQALQRAAQISNHAAAVERLGSLPGVAPLVAVNPPASMTTRPPSMSATPAAAPAPRSLFQALRDWGQLNFRSMADVNVNPVEPDLPGYRDAVNAYFMAIHKAESAPATTQKAAQ